MAVVAWLRVTGRLDQLDRPSLSECNQAEYLLSRHTLQSFVYTRRHFRTSTLSLLRPSYKKSQTAHSHSNSLPCVGNASGLNHDLIHANDFFFSNPDTIRYFTCLKVGGLT